MIELKDICKTYKSKKGINTAALKDINLKLGNKGLTFILGKSGSGKSTFKYFRWTWYLWSRRFAYKWCVY